MRKVNILFCLTTLIILSSFTSPQYHSEWGPTGHRVVGEIAQNYLKKKTKRKICKILNGQSLALVSNYMDDIKSDRKYREFFPWHYVNFADGQKYEDSDKNPNGDLVTGINTCISKLKNPTTSINDQEFYLKLLVHLIGDLHQPLHVGHAEDKGGNDIQVRWFDEGTNIHRVWDSDMIEHYKMSYVEIAENADKLSKAQRKAIQSGHISDWLYESKNLSLLVYSSAKTGEELGYKYMYDHFGIVRSQLQKGGIRLAKILNDIYH